MLLQHISLLLLVVVVVGSEEDDYQTTEKNKVTDTNKNKDLGWKWKVNYRVENEYSDYKKYDNYGSDKYDRSDDYGRYDDDDYDYDRKPSRPRKVYKKKPDSVGSMNIYFKQRGKDKKTTYKKYRFPAARYDHKQHPKFGSLISLAPWLPMLVDRLTKQTFFCTPVGGIIVVPPIVNFFGKVIPVAQLILSGYASLVSTGAPLAPGFNVAPLVSDKPVVGANVPKIDQNTGDFKGAVRVNYEAPKQADPPAYGEFVNPRQAPQLIYSDPVYQQPPQLPPQAPPQGFQPLPQGFQPPPQGFQPPPQGFQPPPPPPPPMRGIQPDRPIYGSAQAQAQPVDQFPQPNYPNPMFAENQYPQGNYPNPMFGENQFDQPRSGFDRQAEPVYPPVIAE